MGVSSFGWRLLLPATLQPASLSPLYTFFQRVLQRDGSQSGAVCWEVVSWEILIVQIFFAQSPCASAQITRAAEGGTSRFPAQASPPPSMRWRKEPGVSHIYRRNNKLYLTDEGRGRFRTGLGADDFGRVWAAGPGPKGICGHK